MLSTQSERANEVLSHVPSCGSQYSRNASGTTNVPLLSRRVTFLTLQRLRTRETISGGRFVQLPERTEANVWQGQCRCDRGWGASGGRPPAALRRRIHDRGLV